MFRAPAPTPYDLRFTIFGFPVRVHPLFWLIMILLGYSSNFINLIIWVVVVFISILIHELGHTFAFRRFGVTSHIVLHSFGGLAIPDGYGWGGRRNLSHGEQIFISLAGPFAGFLLAGAVVAVVIGTGGQVGLNGFLPRAVLPYGGSIGFTFVNMMLWVNIFWGLLNLLPIIPLDGGHVAQHVLTGINPHDGFRQALWLSVVTGAAAAIGGFYYFNSIYMALMFGLLAYQSFQLINR